MQVYPNSCYLSLFDFLYFLDSLYFLREFIRHLSIQCSVAFQTIAWDRSLTQRIDELTTLAQRLHKQGIQWMILIQKMMFQKLENACLQKKKATLKFKIIQSHQKVIKDTSVVWAFFNQMQLDISNHAKM